MFQKLLAAHKAGQLQFFDQQSPRRAQGFRGLLASASNVQADNRTLKELPENFRAWVCYVTNFSRNSDRLGDLPVADLRLRGLDQRRDPPDRGHARSRPCSRPCAAGRARRRGRAPAARPRLSSMSSASIRRRRPPS